MARQFKNARLMNHMKVSDVIRQLDISQPTLSAWEGERKSPSLDKLEQLADLYEVSTDFLLGRNTDNPVKMRPVFCDATKSSRSFFAFS